MHAEWSALVSTAVTCRVLMPRGLDVGDVPLAALGVDEHVYEGGGGGGGGAGVVVVEALDEELGAIGGEEFGAFDHYGVIE